MQMVINQSSPAVLDYLATGKLLHRGENKVTSKRVLVMVRYIKRMTEQRNV